MGFVKADITKINEVLIKWQTPLVARNSNSIVSEEIIGDFNSAYEKLLPLTSGEIRRYLLIPTTSDWVGIMDNSWLGTDRTCPSVLAKLLKTQHIFMICSPASEEFLVNYDRFIVDSLVIIRSVGVMKENGWKFQQFGTPLNFEQIEKYKNRVIKSRFTFDQLNEFLHHFKINAFDPKFYMPQNSALLISKRGPYFPATKEIFN